LADETGVGPQTVLPDADHFAQYSPRVMAAADVFMPSIVPLYMTENASGLDITPIGSACLIWHRGKRYLVTAGHVLSKRLNYAKYVGTKGELVSMQKRSVIIRFHRR
jgi:hypothetical protein